MRMNVKKKKSSNLFELGRQMQEIVDRAFRQAMVTDPRGGCGWIPPMDIAETPDAVLVVLEAPGVKREDLEVNVESGLLKIRGRRREFFPRDAQRAHHLEIDRGGFERVIQIPSGFELDEAQARLEDGLLHVRLPKKTPAQSRIEVTEPEATPSEASDSPDREGEA